MNRALLTAALIAVSLLPAFAQTTATADQNTTAEQEIRRLAEEERAAFAKVDIPALDRIYADTFVVTNPFNELLTKRQVLDLLSQRVITVENFTRELDYVHVYGDTVVAAGRESGIAGGKMPNAGRPLNLRITTVWKKQDGRWQQIARHASIILPPRPGQPAGVSQH